MRTSRAKTVPPGPAMGPNMVLAARKTERVVRERVRRFASAPLAQMKIQLIQITTQMLIRGVLTTWVGRRDDRTL